MGNEERIQDVKELVSKASRISALTGAGISVASGIPDFRSEGGLWERYDPYEYATYDTMVTPAGSLAPVVATGWINSEIEKQNIKRTLRI